MDTPERRDYLKTAQGRGRYLGLESELISIEEATWRHPLIDPRHFACALCGPYEGEVIRA